MEGTELVSVAETVSVMPMTMIRASAPAMNLFRFFIGQPP